MGGQEPSDSKWQARFLLGPRSMGPNLRLPSVWGVCLGAICACEGSPGEARVQVYDPASAQPGWEQTVPSQSFYVEKEAPEGVLRVSTSDYCWESNFVMDFNRATGALLSQRRSQPSSGFGGGLGPLDPPTSCEGGFALRRVVLSSGEPVDVCNFSRDDELVVRNVSDGSERFRLRPGAWSIPIIAGERVVLSTSDPVRLSAYSLLGGEEQWSWTAPEAYTYVAGNDEERLYVLAETSHESHAIGLADGGVVWQKNLGCDSLSLAGELLVCHQTLRASSCEHD